MNSSGWNYDAPDSRPWKLDINTDGTATINTYQDVQPIIEKNKLDLINYGDKLTFGKASGRDTGAVTVASIPINIWEFWVKKTNGDIENNPKLLAKYLNDPDNKFFRTTPTRI
tara:strand:- start:882 stop:1220 length:339 start_codon:yes stop_codon:yes gene_type:complete